MSQTRLLAAVGAILGAAIAVIVHFQSQVAPHVDVDKLRAALQPGVVTLISYQNVPPPHPSWLPILPLGIGIGLATGWLVGIALQRTGWQLALVRSRPQDDDND